MRILQIFLITLLITQTSCNSISNKTEQLERKDSDEVVKKDSEVYPRTGALYNQTPEELKAWREQVILDSLISIRTLDLALKIADKQKHKNQFALYSDTLDITYGNILSIAVKHLIIKRKFPWGYCTNIYKVKENKFIEEFSKELTLNIYVDDTIKDVNGDNNLDYLFHWYPASGCCLRDIYDVYLQDAYGNFSKEIEFLNPTFSPKEQVIRGLCYGYGAPLYKLKWKGFSLDTIEYIYFPDSTNGNNFIRRKHEDLTEKGQILNSLPSEYEKVGYGQYGD